MKRPNLGKYKAYYQRLIMYITAINFLMLFYNFQVYNNWMPWYGWVVVFILTILGVHYIDKKWIWEDDATEVAKKNRILVDNNRLLRKLAGEEPSDEW